MDTVFDILTGAGLGAAAGIRPFLPALAAGRVRVREPHDRLRPDRPGLPRGARLAAGDRARPAGDGHRQRRLGAERLENGPLGAAVSGLALGVGAVLFAGALADHSDVWWPGLIGGLLCALLAERAARTLLRRTRSRLDPKAGEALTLYADGSALLLAVPRSSSRRCR
jgi:hypothetical protein